MGILDERERDRKIKFLFYLIFFLLLSIQLIVYDDPQVNILSLFVFMKRSIYTERFYLHKSHPSSDSDMPFFVDISFRFVLVFYSFYLSRDH